MATAPNSTLDTILEVISGCTVVHACTSEPADFAGIAAVSVGNYPLTPADFTIAVKPVPRDQAKALAFLGSDLASYINGVNLLVVGGFTAAMTTGQVDMSVLAGS